MARKTVRVEMPSSKPEMLLKLGQDILTKNTALGAGSPLDPAKVAKLTSAVSLADSNHSEAKTNDALAQSARQARDVALGIADGQNAGTKDTVLNLVTNMRDQLLLANEGAEEVLSQFGFNVVVGTAKSPVRQLKKAA